MSIRPFFRTTASTVLTVAVATVVVAGIVVAATTVGNNIYSTGGALFNVASTTAFQVENGSGTDVIKVDSTNSGTTLTGAATTTVYHWVGAGGTNTNAGYTGGVLYVQGNAEIDGILYLDRATSTSATSTAYMYIGPDFTEPAGFDFAGGDVAIGSDLVVGNKATSTAGLWVGGTTGVLNNGNMAGGDVYIQDVLEVDTGAYLASASTTDTLTVGSNALGQLSVTQGATTRTGLAVRAAASATANLVTLQNSSGTFLSGFTAAGGLLLNVASTTALRIQDGSGTEVAVFDTVSGGLEVTGAATSTIYLWVGAAGTNTNAGYTGGALYVQGNAEIDGVLYLDRATSTSATTTDYFYVGSDFTEFPGFNFKGGDLAVSGDVAVIGNATTTGNLTIGDGQSGATTTVEIGDASTAGCLKIRDADAGAWNFCYVQGGAFVCSTTDTCGK